MNLHSNLKVYAYFLNICIFYIKFRYLRNLYIAGEQRYPPCPMFMLLSTDGVLVTYYMMYSHADAQAQPITSPPQDLPAGPVRRPTAANVQGLFYTI